MATATRIKHSKLDPVQINQGLTVVYPDQDQPRKSSDEISVDIIAVPGLGANPVYTWKSSNKVDWIRDGNMLRRTVDKARIMVFEFESQWFGRDSVDQRLPTVADQLLRALSRNRPKGSSRPIVFVCHCLGGLVVEQALIKAKLYQNEYPNIFMSVAGCVFLGTPFKGTRSQSKASVLAEMAQSVGMGTHSGLVKLLEDGSETLKDLLHDFSMLAGEARMRLFCFFEQHESDVAKLLSKKSPLTHKEIIVDEESAEILGHNKGGLSANHFELNKFTGPKDGRFIAVSGEISAIVQAAGGILKSRQNALREALIDDATWQTKLEELKVTDPAKDMADSVKGRLASETSWILSNEHYIEWEDKHAPQTLWIHGGAGKGQAVIACSLVQKLRQQLEEKGVFLAYFFCDEKDAHRRNVVDVLKLLIRQMIFKNRDLTEHLLVDSHKGKRAAEKPQTLDDLSVTTLWNSLQSILGDSAVRKVYFVINGLDETDLESRTEFFGLLGPYLEAQSEEQPDIEDSVVKWIFLSRSGRPDIERTLHKALVIDMDDKANDDKVNIAVKAEISDQVDRLAKQKNYNAALTYFIKRHIHSRAEGNYIYVSLIIQELKNLDSTQTTISSIRKQLEDFPYGLTEMFKYIRRRVLSPQSEGIETTKEILRSLIVAYRSPSIFELALMADLPIDRRNDETAIRSYITRCGAFITVSEDEDQSVSFIDVAAKEHLETYARDELSLNLNDVQHGIIALRCLDYVRSTFRKEDVHDVPEQDDTAQDTDLEGTTVEDEQRSLPGDQDETTAVTNQADNAEDPSRDHEEECTQITPSEQEQHVEAGPEDFFVLKYPCEFWLEHAKEAPLDLVEEFNLNDDFWGEESSARDAWWSAYGGYDGTSGTTPLHFASASGYLGLVSYLLDKGRTDDIHKLDSWNYQPLDWACYYGHFDVVQRLIKAGADVNTHRQDGDVFPLWLAALGCRVDVVEFLLQQGAHSDVQDENLGTPLYVASDNGCVPVVRQLLERKSNVNIVGGLHRRALNAAAYCGHTEIVKLLLQEGVNIDPEEEYEYGSALGAAARKGHNDIVRLLLQKGWNASRKLKRYPSSLVVAATYGHVEVVQAILEHRADIGSRELALEKASKNGKADVVKILLEQSHSLRHEKAFLNAASCGRDDVLRLLKERGTNPEMLSTALYQASDSEKESTVRLLLEMGADPDAEGPEYGNALIAAANDGSDGIVQILLEKNADPNRQNAKHGNALQVAASFGNETVVELLIKRGADVNTENIGVYGSALQAACSSGNQTVVELLIEHGADVNVAGGVYGYPIIAAADEAPDKVVEMLVDHGASVNVRDARDAQPLLVVAAYGCQKETLALLLDHGAEIDAADDDGNTALIITADSGDKEGLELLLDRGANIHASGKTYGTALHAAAFEGDEECLQILISRGADVGAESGPWNTPLQAAAFAADLDCVKILLDADADVHQTTGGDYGSALQAAAFSGSGDCMEALVEAGADVNQEGGTYGCPLQAAADSGDLACLQSLLDKGANVNQIGGMYNTALQAASAATEHYECVKLLLDHGADPLMTGGLYGSVMQAAAVSGDVAVWTTLQEHGADLRVAGGKYGNAFQASALKGRADFVQRLLENSIDVNEIGGKYCTALQAAAYADQHDVVKLLCEHGADARICGGFYGNALNAAVVKDCTNVLTLLLEQPLPDSMLDDALLRAVQNRRVQAVEMLLKHGASVEARDDALASAWNVLDREAPEDANSDDGGWSEDEEDGSEVDGSEGSEEDVDGGGDDEDQENQGDNTAIEDLDDDASNVSLELIETDDDQSKILKLLNDAKVKLRQNPGMTRFPTIKRKAAPSYQATAGGLQTTSGAQPQVFNHGSLYQPTGPGDAPNQDYTPEPQPLHTTGESQDFAAVGPAAVSGSIGNQAFADNEAYQLAQDGGDGRPHGFPQPEPPVNAYDGYQAYDNHSQETPSQQPYTQPPHYDSQTSYPQQPPYDQRPSYTAQPSSYTPQPSQSPQPPQPPYSSQPSYTQQTPYAPRPPYEQRASYPGQPSYPAQPSYSSQPSYPTQTAYANQISNADSSNPPPASLMPGGIPDSLDAAFLQTKAKASKFSSSVSKFWK